MLKTKTSRGGTDTMANGYSSGVKNIGNQIRREAARQLRGFDREFKRQLGGFGGEARRQVGGFGHEFARQLFGSGKRRSGW
jgi:hypothetical protein